MGSFSEFMGVGQVYGRFLLIYGCFTGGLWDTFYEVMGAFGVYGRILLIYRRFPCSYGTLLVHLWAHFQSLWALLGFVGAGQVYVHFPVSLGDTSLPFTCAFS